MQSRIKTALIILIVAIATISLAGVAVLRHQASEAASANVAVHQQEPRGSSVIPNSLPRTQDSSPTGLPISGSANRDYALSPDQSRAVFLNPAGLNEVWLTEIKNIKKLSFLKDGEGVANPSWSTTGRLLAFESYNSSGHSPMTTTHVWVVQVTGEGLKYVNLSPPNERFSTYIDAWINDDQLRIRTQLPDPDGSVLYVYSYSTGNLKQVDKDK